MRLVLSVVMVVAVVTVAFCSSFARADAPVALDAKPLVVAPDVPHIDVVFCIDRSGSMRGVIETAKKKVWSIVNETARAKPSPVLRIGLIGYGDAERLLDKLDLTDDLDEVYKHLTTYTDNARSGEEFVGYAINIASNEMKWSDGRQVLKIIYVVGNETAHQGSVDYTKSAPAAIAKGIIVNAIYCGNYDHDSASPTWREFAKLADGQYMEIAGDGGAVVVATPFDGKLAELNTKLNSTYVSYGRRGAAGAQNQAAQDTAAASLAPAVLAERVASKSSAQYSNARWDLVDASKDENFDMTKIKDDELPAEMQKLDARGRKKFIEQKAKERTEIQKSIKDVSVQRDAFVKQEVEKSIGKAPADSFDAAVRDSLKKQAKSKGFEFDEPSK
jgi:hypothetical protein